MSDAFLIVGLGNPGLSYEGTRHNIGFDLVDLLAKELNISFREKKKLEGYVAHTSFAGKQLVLLKPTTYMNLSGSSVKKCARYYRIPSSQILVLVDDVDLPLGEMRIKEKSGAGTHNGLKSVEYYLNSKDYLRLRIGIGDSKQMKLDEFVLKPFSPEEKDIIDDVLVKGLKAIEIWLKQGIIEAMNFANKRVKKNLGEVK
ncbi:MAG: aminoacyl-tRNA hydrolase [Chlamydiota bacterium]|jgi:PTH1 family peptidyl-tRNA hydrolase